MRFRRRRSTNEELLLKEALEKLGVRVLSQVPDGYKHIDLTIPSAKINIEVDGNQHLTDPYQILSDLKRSHYSTGLGYETIHIPNSQINSELEAIAKALAEAASIREKQISQS